MRPAVPDPRPTKIDAEPSPRLARRPRAAIGTSAQRLRFKREVCSQPCVMAGVSEVPCEGELQAAHTIPKQALRRHGFGPEQVWNPHGGMSLCVRHHGRSDAGLERVPFEALPPAALTFAAELGLDWLLERLYPKAEA